MLSSTIFSRNVNEHCNRQLKTIKALNLIKSIVCTRCNNLNSSSCYYENPGKISILSPEYCVPYMSS